MMEIAKLAESEVNIVQQWAMLEKEGDSREKIIDTLEQEYRIHSQKSAFQCSCCEQRVTLVLREDSPHFRHEGKRCPSADNYRTYLKRVEKHEQLEVHRVGRVILRTYLEGQLKIHGIIVEEGYMYRTALKIVPDFILTFPDEQKWSVDYVTGLKVDDTYHRYIKKRNNTYLETGFKPIYFIDSSWLAEVPKRSIITLYLAEFLMKVRSSKDNQWEEFINEYYEVFDEKIVNQELFGVAQLTLLERGIEIYSLAYINPDRGTAEIQRFIPYTNKFGYHVHRSTISLESAVSVSHNLQEFKWWDEEEDRAMIGNLERLNDVTEREAATYLAASAEDKYDHLEPEVIENKAKSINHITSEPSVHNLSSSIRHIIEMICEEMDASLAREIHANIKNRHPIMNSNELEIIRIKARSVMGKLSEKKYMSVELRKALIDIALLT